MSTPLTRLRLAMQRRAIRSGAELARRCGQKDVTVRAHLNGTRAISRKAAEIYCRTLHVEPAWLLFGVSSDSDNNDYRSTGGMNEPMAAAPIDRQSRYDFPDDPLSVENLRPAGVAVPDIFSLGLDVPVLGTAECGEHGAFTLNSGDPIDYVRRPPGIANRKGIYCIYAEGGSMEPVYEAGDLVFADPHRPPRPGRDVVIQLRPKAPSTEPRCFLKRLVRRQSGKWIVKQFNPSQEMSISDKDVVAVHLVLKNHELLGL